MDTSSSSSSSRESLDRFFAGLAAGEELDVLIGTLHRSIRHATCACRTTGTGTSRRRQRDGAQAIPAHASLIAASPSDLDRPPRLPEGIAWTRTIRTNTTLPTASTPHSEWASAGKETRHIHHRTPCCLVPAHQMDKPHDEESGRQANTALTAPRAALVGPFRRAVKAAALFSIESTAAREAMTRLLYTPATLHCIQTRPEQLCAAVLRGQLRVMLSDRVTAAVAHQQLCAQRHQASQEEEHEQEEETATTTTTRSRGDGQRSGVTPALPGRHLAHLSPASAPRVIRLCSRAGLWREALHYLDYIPTAQWGEAEVTAVIRALHRAAQRMQRVGRASSSPHRGESNRDGAEGNYGSLVSADSLAAARNHAWHYYTIARCAILDRAARHGRLRLCTPAAVNDTLALLALVAPRPSPRRRREACFVLDALLKRESSSSSSSCVLLASHTTPRSTVTAEDEDSGVAWSRMLGAVRSNATTVYRLCLVLDGFAADAMRYACRLIARDGVRVERHAGGCEAYLRVCMARHGWQEALTVLRRCMDSTVSSSTEGCCPVGEFKEVEPEAGVCSRDDLDAAGGCGGEWGKGQCEEEEETALLQARSSSLAETDASHVRSCSDSVMSGNEYERVGYTRSSCHPHGFAGEASVDHGEGDGWV